MAVHVQHYDEVIDTVLAWWDLHRKGELQGGIWIPEGAKVNSKL